MRVKDILKEFTDPEGQYTTTAAPADNQEPNQGYVVRLTGIPNVPGRGAQLTWAALMSVLPNDFPADGQGDPGYSGRAQKLVAQVSRTGQPQVVKAGVSKDVAETIAAKIANWPSNTKIPTDVVPQ